eukprot:superscaffoldBa00000076_g1166
MAQAVSLDDVLELKLRPEEERQVRKVRRHVRFLERTWTYERSWRQRSEDGAAVTMTKLSQADQVVRIWVLVAVELIKLSIWSHLEDVVFECGCEIRWLQLWQQRGEAGLSSQQLYCAVGLRKILLQDLNISNCDLPDISVSHSNLTVIEGDRVTATCNGSGSPLPEVDWPVNGLRTSDSQDANVYGNNTIHSINITLVNVSRDDNNFLLTCTATNILNEPERRHDTCIEFTVRGSPHPTLRWFYKDKEISHTEYVRPDMDIYQDYIEGCLTFKNPTHHNNGNYTLEATNYLGVATSTVYGHFLNKPFDVTPTAETHKPEDETFGVSIAVGLAGFACVMLVVLFLLINKYGRRSKFGMKATV